MNSITRSTSATWDRVRYFPRQLLTADDMIAEQQYFREKLRRHNRMLHGWGVVCGCAVVPPQDKEPPWQVTVCDGYLITPIGDEITIQQPISIDLARQQREAPTPCLPSPCPPGGSIASPGTPTTVYLAVCYQECPTRPVKIHPNGCGCDETECDYSRLRESFELAVLDKLPESHALVADEQKDLGKLVKGWNRTGEKDSHGQVRNDGFLPVPPCPPPPTDSCVVVATIKLPKDPSTTLTPDDITFGNRRVLYSTLALSEWIKANGKGP